MKIPANRYFLFFAVVVFGLAADLWTKFEVFRQLGMPGENPTYWLIRDVFGFQTSLNQGALFGMGQGYGPLFCGISVVALLLVFVWLFIVGMAKSRLWTISMAMICAGVLGNMYDRLGLHALTWNYAYDGRYELGDAVYAVRDWILVMLGTYAWPNFNIADALLVCGAALVCIATFFLPDPTKTEKDAEPLL